MSSTIHPDTPSLTTSRTEPCGQAITGVPHASASIIASPNGSGQSIGNNSARGVADEVVLVGVAELAHVLDERVVEQRLDVRAEVVLVARIDLRRDPERNSRRGGDLDRAVDALLHGDPADEREVAARLGVEPVEIARQTVVDGADPVRVRQRRALRVGDRDQPLLGELAVDRREPGQVEAPVQRRHHGHLAAPRDRKGQVVEVGVDHVELGGALERALEHQQVHRHRIAALRVEAQRARRRTRTARRWSASRRSRTASRRARCAWSASVRYETTRSVPP